VLAARVGAERPDSVTTRGEKCSPVMVTTVVVSVGPELGEIARTTGADGNFSEHAKQALPPGDLSHFEGALQPF